MSKGKIKEVIKCLLGDSLEDTTLGYLAKKRELKSKPSDYLSIDEAEKRIRKKYM